jgi:transcriptional regulator with XRE-family HTH domain
MPVARSSACVFLSPRHISLTLNPKDHIMPHQTLGQGLKLARDLRKLSLRAVEEVTGISNPYLSQLENDKINKPSPFFLHKLANLYEISYELLMEAAGYVQRKSVTEGQPKTLAGAALFSTEKLTADEEQKLAEYLNFIRSKTKRK